MAKVNVVNKARTDIYQYGKEAPSTKAKSGKTIDRSQPRDEKDQIVVKKGEKYYWWQFPYQSKQISTTYPTRQQLTTSDFLKQVWDLEDRLGALHEHNFSSPEDLQSEVEDIKSDLETLRDECEEKKSNMPEGLQESGTGEMLQNRYDSVEEMVNEIDGIDLDDFSGTVPDLDGETEKDEDDTDEEDDDQDDEESFEDWLQGKLEELGAISYTGE